MKIRFASWTWSGYQLRAEVKRLPKKGSRCRPWVYQVGEERNRRIKGGRFRTTYIVMGRKKLPLDDSEQFVVYVEKPKNVKGLKSYYAKYAKD